MTAKAIVAAVTAAAVVAVSFIRYAEPRMADRLVHRYGVGPPLVACGLAFAALLWVAHKIDKS